MVSYETVRRWVNHFGPMIAADLRKRRAKPCTTWHLDEAYLKIAGRMVYLWRAVDAEGEVLDVLVQSKRNNTTHSTSKAISQPGERTERSALWRWARGERQLASLEIAANVGSSRSQFDNVTTPAIALYGPRKHPPSTVGQVRATARRARNRPLLRRAVPSCRTLGNRDGQPV